MKSNVLKRVIYVILLALPAVIVVLFYGSMPQEIVMNWGFDGSVEYSPKSELWFIAGMSPVLGILFSFMPKIDPKKANYPRFAGSYELFRFMMAVFFIGMTVIVVSEAVAPGKINIAMVVCLFVGGLFMLLGNMMPKIRSNFFMGIRTPWTLSSRKVWDKTHRLGGWTMFTSGLIIMLSALFLSGTPLFVLVMAVTLLSTGACTVMSYVWYKQEGAEGENSPQI